MMICLSGWQAEGQFMTKTADNVKKIKLGIGKNVYN